MKPCSVKWLPLALLAAAVAPALAIVDNDANGMSDVWQEAYGFAVGAPGSAPPAQDPAADFDGDGYSNLRESIMGTDPRSCTLGTGLFKTTILQQPSVPGVFVVSWRAEPGKQCRLMVSPDLAGTSWTQVGDPILSDGGPIELALASDQATPHLFWRVVLEDVDRESDGLSDYEEYLLGSDPLLAESDLDGAADAAERAAGTDPHAADHPDLLLRVAILH